LEIYDTSSLYGYPFLISVQTYNLNIY